MSRRTLPTRTAESCTTCCGSCRSSKRTSTLVELGPRGTGKSFVYQQMSPYCHLVSGGQTTTAQMFVNLATGQRGLVVLWDVVAFDEAAGIRFPDRNGINIMKGYMEDGAFSRGRDIITAEGSIVFVGNLDGDIETIVRTSNLFYPMPKEMDTAFYDRIHAYIPGWELQKTRDELYTNHFGLVTDYLAEVFRELRKSSYVDMSRAAFRFGSHLGGRDQKAVRKTVSGLIKLLHPDGEVTKEEIEEYLAYAMEMRRRVKEQLKKMGGLEYWDTSFSYIDRDSGQETFVPVPEMGGGSSSSRGACRRAVSTPSARTSRIIAWRCSSAGADESGLWPHHPAGQSVEQDERGDQDCRCLSQGKHAEPRHRPRPQRRMTFQSRRST